MLKFLICAMTLACLVITTTDARQKLRESLDENEEFKEREARYCISFCTLTFTELQWKSTYTVRLHYIYSSSVGLDIRVVNNYMSNQKII